MLDAAGFVFRVMLDCVENIAEYRNTLIGIGRH
jgi:hypothetical protein